MSEPESGYIARVSKSLEVVFVSEDRDQSDAYCELLERGLAELAVELVQRFPCFEAGRRGRQ